MTTRSLPHMDPMIAPLVWRVGPLDRPAVAALIAEIAARVPAVGLRPKALAALPALASDAAVIYLEDVATNARLIPYLLGLGATLSADDGVDAPAWVAGLSYIARWAAAPPPAPRPAAPQPATPPAPTCTDCRLPIAEFAPRSPRLCRPCWRARIAAGRQKQIALDAAWIAARA